MDLLLKRWEIKDNLHKAGLIVGIGIGVRRDGSAGKLSEAVAKRCAQLYKAKLAGKVLMVGGFTQNGVCEARAMGTVAIKGGVKKKDLLYEEKSKSTRMNARETLRLLRNANIHSLILVSQYLHTRRVVATFLKQNQGRHKIYWTSARSGYDDIPGKWQLKSEFRFLVWEYFWYGLYKIFRWA